MKNILVILLVFSSSAHAAFDQTNTRYLSGTEVVEKLNLAFPDALAYATKNNSSLCTISSTDQSAAGFNTPATGRSIYLEPGTAFYSWYQKCTNAYVYYEFTNLTPELIKKHLGPLYKPEIDLDNTNLRSFSDGELMSLINYHMLRLLGPDEVIQEYGYIKDLEAYRQELLQKGKTTWALKPFLQIIERELVGRDEFLSY